MIPAEAIEAAARRLCLLAGYDWDNMDAPEDVVADFKTQLTEQARSILEAAAPHMRAAAWEEGMRAMYDTTSSEWPPIPERNPYRPTA